MFCVWTCQLCPHQAVIVPDPLADALPEQEDGFAQQLQNTVEHVGTLWERRDRNGAGVKGDFSFKSSAEEGMKSS